jgi:4'-phosphopantetheinyl transferase
VDEVRVWLVDADQPDAVVKRLHALLDEGERRRMAALRREEDRRRFVVAHGAVRTIVGRELSAPADQLCWLVGPHGKPELTGRWTGVHVNLSHSGDLDAVAISANRRVGVDVQQVLPTLDWAAMTARFLGAAEAAWVDSPERFARVWTRKEALVKAHGGTLAKGLTLLVAGDGDNRVVAGRRVQDVPAPAGYSLAVAAEGTAAYRVVCDRWRF